jgi:hypothetical protein
MNELCATCGTALAKTGGCEACGSVRAQPKQAPKTKLLVVALRCTFPCRACGFDSPLDQLDGSGGAHYLKCGLHQTFPVAGWNKALPRMHAVADLAGPDPEGSQRDPLWSIAPSGFEHLRTSAAVISVREGTLKAEVGAGHPLCEACGVPVHITVDGPGLLSTECPGCQATASYACQTDAFDVPVVGAIGPEHRVDRADATRSAGAFLCGSCGAPLPVDGLGRLVGCPYCQAVSRIPVQQLQGLAAPPPPDVWFVVFDGASADRERLLRTHDALKGDLALEPPPRGGSKIGHYVVRIVGTAAAFTIGAGLAIGAWALSYAV